MRSKYIWAHSWLVEWMRWPEGVSQDCQVTSNKKRTLPVETLWGSAGIG